MSENKLWRVRVEFSFYVLAPDTDSAEELGEENAVEELKQQQMYSLVDDAWEVLSLDEVPGADRNALPYCSDGDPEAGCTIARWFSARTQEGSA